MKKLCFFNTMPFWGGGEKLHLEYALSFQERGYEVCMVVGPNSPLAKRAKAKGIQVEEWELGKLSFLNPFTLNRLKAFFLKEQIDTLLFSGSQDLKTGGIAAWQAGISQVIYLRGLAIPIKNSWLNRFLIRQVIQWLVASSHETADKIRSRFGSDFPTDKLKVIYHGLDLETLDQQKASFRFEPKAGNLVLGNAGRFSEEKGQAYLIELAEILKKRGLKFHLLLAGVGHTEASLVHAIQARGLEEQVEMIGFVEDIHGFLQSLDVYVQSSLSEGFGLAMVEAMSCAKPVLAFDLSSMPEIIDQGKSGYLLPLGDMEAFADHIQVLAEEPELRRSLGEAGRKKVESHFRYADKVDQLEQLINN